MKLKIQTGKKAGPVRAVIYGVEGIGKTTLAAQLPGPVLFLDLEEGTTQLDVSRAAIADWPALLSALIEIAKEPSGFRTLVIDSADWAERFCSEWLLKSTGKKSIEDFGYGKGYTILAEHMSRALELCDGIIKAGLHVVWVAHSKTVRLSPPDQTDGYDRYELKMSKQVAPHFKEWPDLLLFANFQIQMVEGSDGRVKAQGGKLRQLFTTRSAAWDAKNRYGLPESLPMPVNALAPELVAVFGGAEKAAPVADPASPTLLTADQLETLRKAATVPVTAAVIDKALSYYGNPLDCLSNEQADKIIKRCIQESAK